MKKIQKILGCSPNLKQTLFRSYICEESISINIAFSFGLFLIFCWSIQSHETFCRTKKIFWNCFHVKSKFFSKLRETISYCLWKGFTVDRNIRFYGGKGEGEVGTLDLHYIRFKQETLKKGSFLWLDFTFKNKDLIIQ